MTKIVSNEAFYNFHTHFDLNAVETWTTETFSKLRENAKLASLPYLIIGIAECLSKSKNDGLDKPETVFKYYDGIALRANILNYLGFTPERLKDHSAPSIKELNTHIEGKLCEGKSKNDSLTNLTIKQVHFVALKTITDNPLAEDYIPIENLLPIYHSAEGDYTDTLDVNLFFESNNFHPEDSDDRNIQRALDQYCLALSYTETNNLEEAYKLYLSILRNPYFGLKDYCEPKFDLYDLNIYYTIKEEVTHLVEILINQESD